MVKASGVIFKAEKKEFIPYATVKAYKGADTLYVTGNENGYFSLELPSEGKWTFQAFEQNSFASKAVEVEVAQKMEEIKIYLDRVATTSDEKAGKRFFWILLGIFAALIIFYLVAHLYIFNKGETFAIWGSEPLSYLEVLLWGLAGILVSKIINTGWYLRTQHFYREGIIMHISHLVVTPILALVTVFLLSKVVLKVDLANNSQVSLDLSTPILMVVFSFIIGTSPWVLWHYILDTAKKFMGQSG